MARDPFQERWRRTQDRPDRAPGTRRAGAIAGGIGPGWMGLSTDLEAEDRVELSGTVRGAHLRLRGEQAAGTEWTFRAEVAAPDVPDVVALIAETKVTQLKKRIAGEDILTGDARFDEHVAVSGDEAHAIALLDMESRLTLLRLQDVAVALRRGVFTLEMTAEKRDSKDLAKLEERLRSLIELARRSNFAARPLERRLLDNARRDLEPKVRLANLDHLLARAPNLVSGIREANDEAVLLTLFETTKPDRKAAIAAALGRVGTAASIRALLPHTSGLFTKGSLKEAAKRAIHDIEKRIGSERGRLSIAPPAPGAGELSLSDRSDQGALGLVAEEGGELSVTPEEES